MVINNSYAITYSNKLESTPEYLVTIWGKSEDGLVAEPICSGSLISNNKIITAAHCVYNRDIVFVSFENDSKEYKIDYKINHSSYKAESKLYDLSVLKMSETVDKKYISLPPKNDKSLLSISNLYILGNGFDENNNRDGRYTFSYQNDLSLQGGKYFDEFDDANMIAAGRFIQEVDNFSKACIGDSGAPLIATFGGVDTLLGVVSFGADDCSINAPSVYSRVSSYLEFIDQALESE